MANWFDPVRGAYAGTQRRGGRRNYPGGTRRSRPYNPNISTRYYRSRRFRRFKKKKAGRPSSYFRSKTLTQRRQALGLPPLQKKYNTQCLASSAQQWQAYGAAQFSYVKTFSIIPKGSAITSRDSEVITLLPFTVKWPIFQAADNEFKYRFLVVKIFDLKDIATTPPEPQNYLQTYSTLAGALISQYKIGEDRPEKFQVLFDKTYVINTYQNRNTERVVTFKVRQKNIVKYDPDDTTGDTAEGHIVVLCLTDATAASASFTSGRVFTLYYLDM